MPDINIEFKDKIVEFPHRYAVTDNHDGTLTLTPFPGEVSEVGTPINAVNMNEIVEKHNAVAEIVYRTPERDMVTYTDSIAASTTLTKTISIGSGRTKGLAVVRHASSTNSYRSILVHFRTQAIYTKAVGINGHVNSIVGVGSKATFGVVTVAGNNFGYLATGNQYITIDDLYIDGNTIKVVFRNNDAAPQSLNCMIDYEVE